MDRFRDVYAPDNMGTPPLHSAPRTLTHITRVAGGDEDIDQKWEFPLFEFTMPECIRDWATLQAVRDHWWIMDGPAHTWPFRDPTDFASVNLTEGNEAPDTTPEDQLLGYGDGETTDFQLIKTYSRGGYEKVRNIYVPVVQSLRVAIDGVETFDFSVSRPGGIISFDTAPVNSSILTWGGLFDLEVRFEEDTTFKAIFQRKGASGYGEIKLVEMRPEDA